MRINKIIKCLTEIYKAIRFINCPNCGKNSVSIDREEKGKNIYKCNNCLTELI